MSTITFEQLNASVAAYWEAQKPNSDATTVLTPLGAAMLHANRLASSLQLLSAREQLHILGLLTDQLAAAAQNKPTA